MLNWCSQFNIFCFLDNHQYQQQHHSIECILAVGSRAQIESTTGGMALQALSEFKKKYEDKWIFGHLSYDLKNEIEGLQSVHPDYIGFPDLFFFLPEIVLALSASELRIWASPGIADEVFDAIIRTKDTITKGKWDLHIQSRFSKKEYIDTVKQLQQHILRGDCYEINFCQEFFDDNASIEALDLFFALSEASPNPFSAFYRVNERYLVCASPERFLKKTGNTIYSQPIKGTAKRSLSDPMQDEAAKAELQQSLKERSENVMVVDLVRNDLSRFCEQGSVEVEELFAIYSFPQVHQMISTVKGKLEKGVDPINMIRSSFPMGSMTGAPKRRVMQLIDQYEKSRRGLFSGSVGYFDPAGDFDFNVVIRSILFNNNTKYLSFQTGSAITFYSDPENEYEECQLKAAAIKKVLE